MVSIVFEHNLDEVARFFKDLGKAFDQNEFLKPHLEYGGATAVSMQRQDCPVQSGNLANSLTYTVSGNTVENYTDVVYARDVEARTPYFFANAVNAYESMADTLADYIANILGGHKVRPKPPKLARVKGKANARVGTKRPTGRRRMTKVNPQYAWKGEDLLRGYGVYGYYGNRVSRGRRTFDTLRNVNQDKRLIRGKRRSRRHGFF